MIVKYIFYLEWKEVMSDKVNNIKERRVRNRNKAMGLVDEVLETMAISDLFI